MLDQDFRLSSHVRPERYVFRVAPDLATKKFSASGHIALVVDRPVREVILHGVHLDIQNARIGGNAAQPSTHEVSETITLTFADELAAGEHRLELAWNGVFHDDLRGLYMAGGVGVTQFEAADARRVFPCFDEPPFKAVWEIAIEAPADLTVLANGALVREEPGADGKVVRFFAPTPKMSSYLVAMVVGKLVASSEEKVRGIPVRTFSVPDKAHLTAFAQECSVAVLALLEDYFGRPYAFGKVDNVGIPDFEAGAMENSGLVTYREVVLLLDQERAPLSVRKRVAEVITHELAHQWFGNLVTMHWWDDLWLNEAFATWMAYKIVDQWKPGWRMWDDFEQGKHSALHLDALESTHPIRGEVKNAGQATENFDAITYEKGGAMLRMIEGYLGAEKFRAGIRDYMQKHAFDNATADQLWGALATASGQPIGDVADAWLSKGGYPLVEVARTGSQVTLTQRRFSLDPAKFAAGTDDLWPVPVVLSWADAEGTHEKRHLLRSRSESIAIDVKGELRWLCGNAGGAGFYRVRYGEADLVLHLKHGGELAPVERVNLIADAWALFRAGAGSLSHLLETLAQFANDPDYTVVGEVVSRLDGLERRCLGAADEAAYRAFVANLFNARLTTLGWDTAASDGDDRRLLRAAVLRGLALVGRSPTVVSEAATRLAQTWSGEKTLDPNLLDVASMASARAGGAALFDTFLERHKTDSDPASKRRTLVSLASFESPALRTRALELSLDEKVVPMQDATTYFAALLSNRPARDEAWSFMQKNWDGVRKRTAAPFLTRRLIESLGDLTHLRDEVEAWFDKHAESLAAAPAALRQTRERLRLDADVLARGQGELSRWLQKGR